MTAKLHSQFGFTLAELAIVLVIVALLTGGLMASLGAQRNITEIRETEKLLQEAQEALLGFAIANGRLPRPANSAIDGSERATCSSETDCTGFLPWQALGVRRIDAWNKMLRYSVTPDMANSTFTLTTLGSKRVVGREETTGNLISLAGPNSLASPCNTTTPCAVAVILSHGANRLGTTSDGLVIANTSASNADEVNNDTGSTGATAGTVYISRNISENTATTGGEFDDLVLWLSPNILYNRMIAAGKLP